eukprot:TRINITY_DN939_c0_g1_i7.p1 TRINITY_DN939_c0_g1~~TRINITY_DN939_c0_g1_i7.p1  ORF type:complete len:143 (+),score=6.03 TRINITY_DN939_c0_g1_i7:314-742(+)
MDTEYPCRAPPACRKRRLKGLPFLSFLLCFCLSLSVCPLIVCLTSPFSCTLFSIKSPYPPVGCREIISINSIPAFWKFCARNFLFSVALFVSTFFLSSFTIICFFLPSQSIPLPFFKQTLTLFSPFFPAVYDVLSVLLCSGD